MSAMPAGPDEGLSLDALSDLNRRFYRAEPWRYFEGRLANLMLVASDAERYRDLFSDGVTYGDLSLLFEIQQIEVDDYEEDPTPSPEQSFAAIETEVLLHHSAETLLRLTHAHVGKPPCPWLRMSKLTSPAAIKGWISENITAAEDPEVARLCAAVFAIERESTSDIAAIAEFVRLYGRHFLDADSYNAAKHGMALHGDAAQWTMQVAGDTVLDHGGPTVSWLSRRSTGDPAQPSRWAQTSRIVSLEATVVLILTAIRLMESIWLRARHTYLNQPLTRVFRLAAPDRLFATLGVRHPVLADVIGGVPASG